MTTHSKFTGNCALVTGAGRGIGQAIAERLAADGAHVLIADIDHVRSTKVVKRLLDRGLSAEALTLDVSDVRIVELAAKIGALDIVVANAGIQTFAPAAALTVDEWNRVLDINARGVLLTLQLAAKCLVDGGSIVTVASIQAHLPNPLSAHYAASKAAVLSLTRTFATALAPQGIRVNAVAPGRIDTDLSEYASVEVGKITGEDADETLQRRISTNPLGRTGTADEVAAAVAFLASDDASYITGECINVCGGDVML
ncbi:SDR family NAD(P)-dependent oxidoreductase [Rhodococcoides kyotonense]|uniref:3-oxoacyl-[acyl-carrier protein] reductase/meso-butanediol dehydrogenase / (S,S)-butanediol dehydrogenase / diacetyl reductase n=1 Tax=Rhodococcoides kyotonense TaxID=398843 RepID=A0A239N3B5_9NOCA|nr:SDR family NAD(P)-dependent oxidoreductase [Rhodococcus kyotonensis]SNT48942.1 3-oxoacyl-[acyl-carrier protein] reductase/meso-butanediol dehydrogenase / (S,S)-butanediol dehydrogenase / diacetyl reductase [Rhodococcus kyotonensis]